MRLQLRMISVVVVLLLTAFAVAGADERPYLLTRPYGTAMPGEVELEYWFDSVRDYSRQQVEVELGVTPNYHMAFYGVWKSDKEHGFQYSETKWENKVRLAQPGDFFVDPALYVEFKFSAIPDEANGVETKLILSKDFDDWNVTANFNFETEFRRNSKIEFEYVLGVSHPVSDQFQLGLEYLDQPAEGKRYLVPGIYSRLGNFKFNLGLQFGLNQADDSIGVHTLTMFEF